MTPKRKRLAAGNAAHPAIVMGLARFENARINKAIHRLRFVECALATLTAAWDGDIDVAEGRMLTSVLREEVRASRLALDAELGGGR